MLSIKNSDKYEETIKYSKFISLIFRVNNIKEVNLYLDKTKKEYPLASHYCYGYVIDSNMRFSDDGEPAKTAGNPIIMQIQSHNLNYTLIVVVRYFGGVKLGTGPLTRTYSKMAREVIRKDNIIELIKGYSVTIIFEYSDIKDIDYILGNSKITYKDFSEKITYKASVSGDVLDKLDKYNIKIDKEIYIEKE